jgi:3-dehydroquinate synthase
VKVTVQSRAGAYDVDIGPGLLRGLAEDPSAAGISGRVAVVTDSNVRRLWGDGLRDALAGAGLAPLLLEVPPGEGSKTLARADALWTGLIEAGLGRGDTVLALGGGVVGDLAGFVAATFHRGMRLLQLPTTLLAQVDSSVGGKTAVNHPLGKNMIGAFHQPSAVIIDTATLSTLPEREYVAGIAEVIKYGAACDATFFDWIESHVDRMLSRDADAIAHAVHESCRIKAQVVARDEREAGERAVLNFGHTFGHAIEAATGYGTWLHGEAVAAGMVLATALSQRVSGLGVDDANRLKRLIDRAGVPVAPPVLGFDRWMELMARDKKAESGAMRFVLLKALGAASVRSGIDEADLRAVLAA